MNLRRLFLPLFLGLMLAIGALHASAMRLQVNVAGSIVICSGAGMVTVQVDGQGRPVTAPHLTPDCTMTGPASPGMEQPPPLPHVMRLLAVVARPAPVMTAWRPQSPAVARGPPILI